MSQRPRPETIAVQGTDRDRVPGEPLSIPLVQSSTFLGSAASPTGLLYTRYGNNPTQLRVARKLAALEGTESAIVLSSGMGAIAMTSLALAGEGGHIVASRDLYGATRALFSDELPSRGIETTFVDASDPESWGAALRDRTRLLYLEVPANPALRVHDPRVPAALAAERGITLAVDATFASPVNLRPAALGAGAVIHSATKYLGGHSDLVAGVVCASGKIVERVRSLVKLYGPAVDPHGAWLLDRGLQTLELRVRRQNQSAQALAEWLEGQEGVERIVYPGLSSHPDHRIARELLAGFGGMLAIVVEGGAEAADRFCDALEVIFVAPSLGGVETLVSQPRLTSHLDLPADERARIGMPDGFLRFSIGVEDIEDLREDLERGLAAARAAG